MVLRRCIIEHNGKPGLYQVDYDKEYSFNKNDPTKRPTPDMEEENSHIQLNCMYGNKYWVTVETAIIRDGDIKFRLTKYMKNGNHKKYDTCRSLEANIGSFLEKIQLPIRIKNDLNKAFKKELIPL